MPVMISMLGRWYRQHQLVDHGRIACVVAIRFVASTLLGSKQFLELTAKFVEACLKAIVLLAGPAPTLGRRPTGIASILTSTCWFAVPDHLARA
jgi:hypothetical protein